MKKTDDFEVAVEATFAAEMSNHYLDVQKAVAAGDQDSVMLMLKGMFCLGYGMGMRHVVDSFDDK